MRHRYPFSVSIVKYISNTIFWLIKLKPINACGLTAIDSGCLAEVRDINEQIALYWGMEMMLRAVTTNYIPELITSSPENVKNVRAIMYSYIKNNVYFDKKGFPMEGTQKYKETVYYFRYKKFTAVNIYEMIVHMIIGFREGRGMPPLPEATI